MTDIDDYYSRSDPISRCTFLQETKHPSRALVDAACHDPDFRVRYTIILYHFDSLPLNQIATLKQDPSVFVRTQVDLSLALFNLERPLGRW